MHQRVSGHHPDRDWSHGDERVLADCFSLTSQDGLLLGIAAQRSSSRNRRKAADWANRSWRSAANSLTLNATDHNYPDHLTTVTLMELDVPANAASLT